MSETHRLDDADVLAHVLDHLDALVLKPVDGAGGDGIVIGPQGHRAGAGRPARRRSGPTREGWIAQRPVAARPTSPTLIGDRVAPRHIDLRPFAVNDGDDVWLLPGGLTRVALPEGTLVVNSSQGGGSKDTWVLADSGRPAAAYLAREPATRVPEVVPARTSSTRDSPGAAEWR